jgi:hypothetical protein
MKLSTQFLLVGFPPTTIRYSIFPPTSAKRDTKTYNSGDSLVVTHLTTNPPVSCLNRAERTGSLASTHATVTESVNFSVCSKPLFCMRTISTDSSLGGLLRALGRKRY